MVNSQWVEFLEQHQPSSISERSLSIANELYHRYTKNQLKTEPAYRAFQRALAVAYSVVYRESPLPKHPKMEDVKHYARVASQFYGHHIDDPTWRVVSCIMYEELRT